MLGLGKGVLGVVRISRNEGGAGTFPDTFSAMDDSNGYNDSVILATAISAIYELYAQSSWSHESAQLMRSILGNYCTVHHAQSCLWLTCCICMLGNILSIDHTMKTAGKVVIVNKSHQHIKPFLAVFQFLDEESKILAWVHKCLFISCDSD